MLAPSSTDITVGDVLMNAADSLVLLTSNYEPNDNLEAGDITLIGEGNFGFGINARNFIGTGGTVFIDARGDINVINSSIRTTALTEIGDIVLLAEETVRFDGADGSRITGAFASIAAGSEYSSGGTVRINANNLEVLNGAQVASSVFGTGQGGDILFNITETASFVGSNAMNGTPSGAFSTIARGGEGQGGNIEITAHELDVLQGGQISASSFGIGATGSMVLTIAETARFVGSNVMDGTPSGAFSNIARGGEGQGGDVRVQASNIEIRDGANLSASISGVGEAGNILLTVQDTVQVLGSDSVVASQIGSNGQGQGGNVEITARELEVLQGGQIGASLFGIGAAGNVVLTIDETARFVGVDPIDGSPSGVFSSLESAGEGSGGKVEIRARNLDVFDGAILSASNSGTGEAGSIVVEVEDIVRFVGIDLSTSSGRPSGAISAIGSNGLGTGGNVEVTAANLEVLDGAQLIASTLGIGQAGTIVLDISETARFSGVNSIVGVPSGAFSQIEPSGAGISGDILVHARALEVLDGAQLSTSVFGSGSAGNVILNVLETARFIGSDPIDDIASGAFSRVNSGGEGKGGNVIARAANLEVLEGAQISASTFGIGPAGSVILEVTETARFIGFDPIDGSPSGAFSTIDLGAEGRGGNVEVQASNLDILRGAVLSSRTSFVENSLNELSGDLVDTTALTAGSCIARRRRQPGLLCGDGG
jgi:large exoprotein involved in heme utilization and adhesion